MAAGGHRASRATRRRNQLTAGVSLAVVAGMVGLAYASVPLYRLFCQVTGFNGTPQVAAQAPATIGERTITVRFNADTAGGLNWRFKPSERQVVVRVGEQRLAFYQARNLSDRPITGTATFNVTPVKAGAYFAKVDCFCFTEQTLKAGESAEMPVSFFIDPEIVSDPEMDDVTTITLSYTFFEAPGAKRKAASVRRPGAAGRRNVN